MTVTSMTTSKYLYMIKLLGMSQGLSEAEITEQVIVTI